MTHPIQPVVPPPWTFLSNHAHVLLTISKEPTARIRDIAAQVGITERGVQRIIAELEAEGYLSHQRDGRRNIYEIDLQRHLRHPVEEGASVAELLELLPLDQGRSSIISIEEVDSEAEAELVE